MNQRSIAYFSMEIALDAVMPTYAGGLGVLAGDTIRSAADLSVPMVAVTLLGESCDKTHPDADRGSCDAASLYDKLERTVLPLFRGNRDGYADVMRHSISLNGSFFNTQRMLQQYVVKAYLC